MPAAIRSGQGEGEGTARVRDYATFLEYLGRKHPGVRTGALEFPFGSEAAKSVVLYTLPGDMDGG